MKRYVAFQLGINVGKRQVKMAVLKEVLEKAGFQNVKTLLASGNVVLDSDETNIASFTSHLNEIMTKQFGFEIKNIVRSAAEIIKLVASDPFKEIQVTSQTRLYITFLSEPQESSLAIPYESAEKDYSILKVTPFEVISVLIVSGRTGTTDAMKILGKEFGRNITTRNWNTLVKFANI